MSGERRLHPMSWLFIVLEQLKAFALPLLILLVTGRSNRSEWMGLIGVGGIAIAAVVRYLTFRFSFGPGGVVILSGVFQRTRREIPYERIHDVLLHRSVLHRLFGVAEVRLESAAGAKSEGEMRVLSLADAQAIEAIVRRHTTAELPAGAPIDEGQRAVAPLFALNSAEVVRLGLISNRGLVVVAALAGALAQALPDTWSRRRDWTAVWRFLGEHSAPPEWLTGPVAIGAAAVAAALLIVTLLRVLSVSLALLQFYGFTLTQTSGQLRLERGLLTRLRHHVPVRRIQAWAIHETLLHRWFGRRSLTVDSAVNPGEDDPGTRDLIPIATPDRLTDLVSHFLGRLWLPSEWRPLHPRAWRRLIVLPSLVVITLCATAVWRFGSGGLGVLVLLPVVVVRARLWVANAAYAEVPGGLIAVRAGWLNRTWRFAEIRKLQTVRLTESPFDRRHGMATLWLDTAGAQSRDGAFRLPFLPAPEARALYGRMIAGMDREPT